MFFVLVTYCTLAGCIHLKTIDTVPTMAECEKGIPKAEKEAKRIGALILPKEVVRLGAKATGQCVAVSGDPA